MGSGRVIEVYGSNVREESHHPARTVVVDPGDGKWIEFEIAVGIDPDVGAAINWGPHYAWWGSNVRVHKLTWERDFNAPLSPA